MSNKTTLLSLTLAISSCTINAEPLSIERLFSDPGLSGKSPVKLKFSPTGRFEWDLNYICGSKLLMFEGGLHSFAFQI